MRIYDQVLQFVRTIRLGRGHPRAVSTEKLFGRA